MKIQVPETGRRAPVLTGSRVGVGAFVDTNVQATDALAAQAVNTVVSMRAQEQHDAKVIADKAAREAEQRRDELKRAQNVGAYAGFQADLDEFTDGLTAKLAAKGVTRDKLPEEFDKGVADLKKKRMEGLDPHQQAIIDAHFVNAERGARNNIRKAAELDVKQERVATISTTLEDLQRLAVKDPAKAIGQANMLLDAEGPGVLGADKVAVHKQQFAEKAYASHFTNRLNQVRNDSRGLAQLEADIAKTTTLDPDKANILLGRAAGFREVLASKAERAQASRLRTVTSEITKANVLTMQGYDVPAEQLLAISQASKGTELEGTARQMVAFSNETSKFRAMKPGDQQNYLNGLEANVRKQPSAETAQFVEKLKGIARSQNELIQTDSMSFAEQKGVADVTAIDLSTALTNPAALKDQFKARLNIARGMKAQYGAPLLVLKKAEAEMLPKLVEGMPPKQKAEALKAIGSLVEDPVAMRDLAAQIHSKDKGFATAMFLASRGDRLTKGANLPELYLIGQDALFTKQAKIDERAEIGARSDISKRLEGVYATTTARDMAADVALKVFAAGKATGVNWSEQQATEIATGGLMELNGGRVAKPYGWTDNRFRDALRAVTPESIKTQAGADTFTSGTQTMTADQLAKMLPSARLQTVGDGRYTVIAGADYLRRPDRSPLVLEIR